MYANNKRNIIDFAPGENHIAIRHPSKCYYVPEVFHMAPTCGETVPLFIRDINRGKTLLQIYGSLAFEKYMDNYILVNNYPIQKIKITGKIIGEVYKDFGVWGERNPKNFVLVNVDDFSGDGCLTIYVKIKESLYLASGLTFNKSYGKVIEVLGVVNEFNDKREVLADYLSVIGTNDELDVEVESWKQTLEFRNTILAKPWIYKPPTIDPIPQVYCEPKMLKKDYERKQRRENLHIFNNDVDMYPNNFTEDSLLLFQHSEPKPVEFVDLTDCCETDNVQMVEEIDDSCIEIMNSEIQIIKVNQFKPSDDEEPVQILCEFQLTLEFIKWMLEHGLMPFKLIDIYKDFKIQHVLDNLTQLKILSEHLSPGDDDFADGKHVKNALFHTARHILQINYRLITVSKNQNVNLTNLFQLENHLKYYLNIVKQHKLDRNETKILNIEDYLRAFKAYSSNLIGEINYKLINGIIDWILTNDFNDRNNWKYDSKLIEWTFIG